MQHDEALQTPDLVPICRGIRRLGWDRRDSLSCVRQTTVKQTRWEGSGMWACVQKGPWRSAGLRRAMHMLKAVTFRGELARRAVVQP